jgi:alpha-N-arabinofuranosidase
MKNKFKGLIAILFFSTFTVNAQQTVELTLDFAAAKTTINKNIYGHFSEHLGRCIYDGFWVNDTMNVEKKDRIRLDVVKALKDIQIPNLRWPGGCFADEYHWRDGIGARNQRPKMINTNWGGITEDNSFGTHEFLELCSLLNCEPYIAGNVGSGTVEEMSKWIEYINFDGESTLTNLRKQNGHAAPFNVKFWGVGNESWGCGGTMTAEYYANEYRRYASFCKNYPNAKLLKIAAGANSGDYKWTETLMQKIPLNMMWGVTLHYYTIPTGKWNAKGSATSFNEDEYFKTMKNSYKMEELVTKHSAIMDKYDSARKVALVVDEWGIWTDVEPNTNPGFLYQQNSLRDAFIAGINLNIFNNHADRVRMANLAQTVNVLQSLILTKGNQMLLTPTYYVFDLYKVHQNAKLIPAKYQSPTYQSGADTINAVSISASKDSTGTVHITLVNIDPSKSFSVNTVLENNAKNITGKIITSTNLTDINTFENKNTVVAKPFSSFKKNENNLSIQLPAKSIVSIEIK